MRLELVDRLVGSSRSRVRRARGDRETLIVKEFTGSGVGWIREAAALSIMPSGAPTPRLVTTGTVPPIVVMSDAGQGASVADALLGTDPGAAADAVVAWATAMASLHRVTAGLRDAFRDALVARAADTPVPESTMSKDLADAAGVIARYGDEFGVDVPAHALTELRELGSRLSGAGPAAMTPADACPDNNVYTADGLVLIDFEGAQWRHLAWDIAYLVVPWPSCWCSWQLPADVAVRAMDAYRARLALPYADSAGFDSDVAAAATGWAFVSTSWFLPSALLDDPPMNHPARPAPSRRAIILHRLRQASESVELPGLAELASRLCAALTERWGRAPLEYAPAFRPTKQQTAG